MNDSRVWNLMGWIWKSVADWYGSLLRATGRLKLTIFAVALSLAGSAHVVEASHPGSDGLHDASVWHALSHTPHTSMHDIGAQHAPE